MIDTTNKKNVSFTMYRQYIEGLDIILSNISKESGIKFKGDLYQYIIGCFLNQVLKGNVDNIIDDENKKMIPLYLKDVGVDTDCFTELEHCDFRNFVELKSQIHEIKLKKEELEIEYDRTNRRIEKFKDRLLELPVENVEMLLTDGYYTIQLSDFRRYANDNSIKSFTKMDNNNVQNLKNLVMEILTKSNKINETGVLSDEEEIEKNIRNQNLKISYKGVSLIIDCRINFDELYE